MEKGRERERDGGRVLFEKQEWRDTLLSETRRHSSRCESNTWHLGCACVCVCVCVCERERESVSVCVCVTFSLCCVEVVISSINGIIKSNCSSLIICSLLSPRLLLPAARTHTHTYLYTHTHTCTHRLVNIHTHMHIYTYTHTYTHILYIHTHTYTHTHIYTHTHT